jgi:alpha-beta hydrolase superfamily lysophospholipase
VYLNTDRESTTRRIARWNERKEMGETLSGTVTTESGTPVAYWRSGKGPPSVLVHATAADHGRWRPVSPALEERFSVYAIDRRGRGGSGDAEDYSVEKEFEDVAAVVDSLGKPVNLLGYSYGGLLALDRIVVMDGQGHSAMYTGTDLFTAEVLRFLEATKG